MNETKTEHLKRLKRMQMQRYRARKRLSKAPKTFKQDPKPECCPQTPRQEPLFQDVEKQEGINPMEPFMPPSPRKGTYKEQHPEEYCRFCGHHKMACSCRDREEDEKPDIKDEERWGGIVYEN